MNNQKNEKLSVDALMSRLLQKRTITPLFRWTLDIDNAVRLLSAAYRAEVAHKSVLHLSDISFDLTQSVFLELCKAVRSELDSTIQRLEVYQNKEE